jgi:LysR family transcriptional regulator, glycine cleavage system transcriptional activator
MTHLLPPLNALRAFEAAARHLSFKLAAHELYVTPGAVAQQVKNLEAQLGIPLFERLHRQLVLTQAGQAYLPSVHKAFARIAAATDALRPLNARAAIRLGVHAGHDLPSLLRRIEGFRAQHGNDIHVRISQPAGLCELVEGKVNVLIDRDRRHHPGYRCEPLQNAVSGGGNGPTEVFICAEGTVECPEIVALRAALAGPTS